MSKSSWAFSIFTNDVCVVENGLVCFTALKNVGLTMLWLGLLWGSKSLICATRREEKIRVFYVFIPGIFSSFVVCASFMEL